MSDCFRDSSSYSEIRYLRKTDWLVLEGSMYQTYNWKKKIQIHVFLGEI